MKLFICHKLQVTARTLTDIVMRQTIIITTLLFLILTISSYGQVDKRKNYFPIWTYHQKNINIHGISLGIGTVRAEPRYTNTNGIKIELIGSGIAIPYWRSFATSAYLLE